MLISLWLIGAKGDAQSTLSSLFEHAAGGSYPNRAKIRRTFSFSVAEKGLANWLYRRALDRWVQKRYRTTDYFFALSQRLSSTRLAHVAMLARQANVELETHPIVGEERDLLLGSEFEVQFSDVARKSYLDL